MAKEGKYSPQAILGICGMLVFGTGTMISSKLMLDTSACPVYDSKLYPGIDQWKPNQCPPYVMKKFSKPWYQTALMFFGMFFCIFGHIFNIIYDNNKAKSQAAAKAMSDVLESQAPAQQKHKFNWKSYTYVGVPALFDMVATALMTYGLVFINVSIMQMLRGCMIVFASFFNVWCLKRKIRPYQWASVCVTVIALILVGVSCFLNSGSGKGFPWDLQMLGCALVIISTAVQASQIVVEDFMLSGIQADPLQIVGMEGLWGLFVTCAIIYPIANAIPGKDSGSAENIKDTFYMLGESSKLIWQSVVYFVAILFLNWAGMVVTQQTSSVVRTIFEAVRTAAIWAVNLLIFYVFMPDSVYGEAWTTYSWIQLAGFIMLIFASQCYNGYAKFTNIFRYDFRNEERKEEMKSLVEKGEVEENGREVEEKMKKITEAE